jgi:hypothetical protein
MNLKLSFIGLLLFFSVGAFAQKVSGHVAVDNSNEPVPFANVWIKGTLQGATADANGRFTIENPQNDTILISSIGFKQKEIIIDKHKDTNLVIELKEDVKLIDEVTVKPEIPRAKVLFKKILDNKKSNRERIRSVNNYKTLVNTTVFVAIDTASGISHLIEDFDEVTIETEHEGIRFSPIYLDEKAEVHSGDDVGKLYNKKGSIFPHIDQAIESLILKNVVVDLDFYKDQIFILDRGFISPLSNSAMLYYNLYLNDSTVVDNIKHFNFSFAPKNKYNPLFSGNFTIEDSTFALTRIEVHIPREANLNFVNGFKGNVSFKKMPDGKWFYDSQKVDINLAFTLNKDSVTKYSSQRIKEVSSGTWLINKTTQYSTSRHLDKVNPEKWKSQPEFASGKLGEDAYNQVDKLKDQKLVKGVDAVGGLALTGFLNAGKIDIGPVFDIYSTNTIEGHRLTIPLRTSEKMFKRFSVGGFLGYGTKNEAFKYGANLIYQPTKTDKLLLRLNYSNDYNLVTQDKYLHFVKNNPNNKGNGNFIAALTTREKNPYLKEDKSYKFGVSYHTNRDINLEVAPYFMTSTSTPDVKFIRYGTEIDSYDNYGVLFNARFTFGQHFDKFFFDRVYYLNPIPVINLSWDMGQVSLPDNSERVNGIYSHFHGSIKGRVNMGQVFMHYMVNGGYLFGDAPYDLLDQPVGSMSLGYAKYRYNLLHHAAFAHNVYANTHFHFNGGGIILNRIPFIRKLKLREIVSFKGHYGKLTSAYKGVFDLPEYYHNTSNTPYAEIGFGLTNIFKILRVEYVHQLGNTYADTDFTDNSGILFRAEMSF